MQNSQICHCFQIGNAYIDGEDQRKGKYDYYWTHALISDDIHQGIVQNCNFSLGATLSQVCLNYTVQAREAKGNVYGYDIYAPLCSTSSNTPPVHADHSFFTDIIYQHNAIIHLTLLEIDIRI